MIHSFQKGNYSEFIDNLFIKMHNFFTLSVIPVTFAKGKPRLSLYLYGRRSAESFWAYFPISSALRAVALMTLSAVRLAS